MTRTFDKSDHPYWQGIRSSMTRDVAFLTADPGQRPMLALLADHGLFQ
jgi:hypothetical protein